MKPGGRLHEAIPILGRLCRIFAGFGIEHEVPEQAVALDALASIGGHDARVVISGLLEGPTLKVAVRGAAAVRCRLSAVTVLHSCGTPTPRCAPLHAVSLALEQ